MKSICEPGYLHCPVAPVAYTSAVIAEAIWTDALVMTLQLADYVSQHLTVWSVAKITVFKTLKEPLTFLNKPCVCSLSLACVLLNATQWASSRLELVASFNEAVSHVFNQLGGFLGWDKYWYSNIVSWYIVWQTVLCQYTDAK